MALGISLYPGILALSTPLVFTTRALKYRLPAVYCCLALLFSKYGVIDNRIEHEIFPGNTTNQ